MMNKEFQLESKYPNPFSQNEIKNNPNESTTQNENMLFELNNQINELSLGYESIYRKESTPLPQNPMVSKLFSNPSEDNLKTEQETKQTPYMHKMSEGSLNEIAKNKNAFVPPQGNMRDNSSKILKVNNGNSDKYLPSVNYSGNSQTSPICSYYNSSQKYFSHSLQKETVNDELDSIPESQNFIRKSSIEEDMEPNAFKQQDLSNPFNAINDNDDLNGYEDYINQNPQGFNQNYLDMKYNFFTQNNQQQTQESSQMNSSLIPNYGLTNQNLFRSTQQMNNNTMKKAKGNLNPFDFGAYNMMQNNTQNDQEEANANNDNDNGSSQNSKQSIHSDDYIFEKYGKKGWMCEKCNNFNFENRKNCNRCNIPKQPKLLSKIKEKNPNNFPNPFKMTQGSKTQMSTTDERKRKPFTERKGDWRCSQCHNLNFAFRLICNMCQLPLYQSSNMNTNMKMIKPNKNINSFPQSQMPIQMPNQPAMQMQFQPQLPYQFQQLPRIQQNQVNPFYQNMLNNQINIYNNYYSMMHQNMLNKKQNQFN